MPLLQGKERSPQEWADYLAEEIKTFARTSPGNRMPSKDDYLMFDEPLVGFADGADPLFIEYKSAVAPVHNTPREALARAYSQSTDDMPASLSVISWVLPITERTRKPHRNEIRIPTRLWSYTRWYGEKFNDAVRVHMVELLRDAGYLAVAPVLEPYFEVFDYDKGKGAYSNWSERHIAYAAGLGTFSLSDGFITERGVAERVGSVVTNLALPASPRTAGNHYANCLFYVDGSCKACIVRCPAGAISEHGHDKVKCMLYQRNDIGYLLKDYEVGVAGCGLCQTKVPCESRNPTRKLKRTSS
jgi:epoxyqueuosine reductase